MQFKDSDEEGAAPLKVSCCCCVDVDVWYSFYATRSVLPTTTLILHSANKIDESDTTFDYCYSSVCALVCLWTY